MRIDELVLYIIRKSKLLINEEVYFFYGEEVAGKVEFGQVNILIFTQSQ